MRSQTLETSREPIATEFTAENRRNDPQTQAVGESPISRISVISALSIVYTLGLPLTAGRSTDPHSCKIKRPGISFAFVCKMYGKILPFLWRSASGTPGRQAAVWASTLRLGASQHSGAAVWPWPWPADRPSADCSALSRLALCTVWVGGGAVGAGGWGWVALSRRCSPESDPSVAPAPTAVPLLLMPVDRFVSPLGC
eukprot:COSAG02_NODE_16456_length_1081_cov_7.466102_2_plen_198_part_00